MPTPPLVPCTHDVVDELNVLTRVDGTEESGLNRTTEHSGSNSFKTREEWLRAYKNAIAALFRQTGVPPVPENIRLSCGFPSRGALFKQPITEECWAAGASGDGTVEVFISPALGDPFVVAGATFRMLLQAALGLNTRRREASAAAKAMGLEGRWKQITESDRFKQLIQPVLDALGPYPHAALVVDRETRGGGGGRLSNAPAKQTTRLLKCECPADHGYVVRIAKKWIVQDGPPHCPLHGEMRLVP